MPREPFTLATVGEPTQAERQVVEEDTAGMWTTFLRVYGAMQADVQVEMWTWGTGEDTGVRAMSIPTRKRIEEYNKLPKCVATVNRFGLPLNELIETNRVDWHIRMHNESDLSTCQSTPEACKHHKYVPEGSSPDGGDQDV